MALAYKNLPFEYIPINLMTKENETHQELTGVKQVPTLYDSKIDFKCSQSMAIMQYIDAKNGSKNDEKIRRLFPECPQQLAQTIEIAEIQNSFMMPLQNISVLRRLENY